MEACHQERKHRVGVRRPAALSAAACHGPRRDSEHGWTAAVVPNGRDLALVLCRGER